MSNEELKHLEEEYKKMRLEISEMQIAKQDGSCKEYEETKKTHSQRLSEND